MANMTTEQALQLPQQLRQSQAQTGGQGNGRAGNNASGEQKSNWLSDELVTISSQEVPAPEKKIDVRNFKSELGSDAAYVRETLRNKLAEYRIPAAIPVSLGQDMFGNLELEGNISASDSVRIREDLQRSQDFMNAFKRVSQQQPTLEYVDNVVKISKAYGVSNTVFNTLLSENKQFNGLNDIAHRYQSMKSHNQDIEAELGSGSFHLKVN